MGQVCYLIVSIHDLCLLPFFTNLKDGLRPGHSEIVVTNAYIAAATGIIKQNTRLTVKIIAHGVGISQGSADKILTHEFEIRKVCTQCVPIA